MAIDLQAAFNAARDEYIKFERVEAKRHERPDLHAFLLLTELLPGKPRAFIACAEHDEIWLDVNCDELSMVATQEQIVELTRCGVRYQADVDSLAMFV